MAIYMEWDGGKIKGGVTESSHKDWIEIASMQFGVGRGIHTPVGSASKREASMPSVSEITLARSTDRAATSLFQEACVGVKGVPVKIHVMRTGATEMKPFMEYDLEDTLLSGYSYSSGGDAGSETISLNFTKITIKYTPSGEAGEDQSPLPAGFDITTGKKV